MGKNGSLQETAAQKIIYITGFNMMNNNTDMAGGRQIIRIISVGVLLVLLSFYLFVTIDGTNRMASQARLIMDHQFAVSNLTNKMLINKIDIELNLEKLRGSDVDRDVKAIRGYADNLYRDMDQNMLKIQELYLGSKESMDGFMTTYSAIRLEWNSFFSYLLESPRSEKEFRSYENEHLSILSRQFERDAQTILDFANKKQKESSQLVHSLRYNTIYWSLIISFVCLAGMFFFLRLTAKLNDAVVEKNKQFDLLGRTVDEAFLLFDRKDKSCYYVSENSERVLGVPAKELLEDRNELYRYMSGSSRFALECHVDEDAPQSFNEELLDCRLPGESEPRRLHSKFFSVHQDNGRVVCVVTISDITKEVKAQLALRDALTNAQNANNAKRDFLSRMSHEIRTPMNAIIGMTTIAAANTDDAGKVEDCLKKIGQASKHLLMLINDVLDMSRIESNKVTMNLAPFDINQLVSNITDFVYGQTRQNNVEFFKCMEGFEQHTVYIGDSLRINQVLLNLMSNAIKFTPPGGRVGLEIICTPGKERNDSVRFIVSDTGIGMNEDTIKRIYDPFEQADAAIAQKYGGSGLGMSITKNLISLMNGHIHVKSEPGKGSVFTVELTLQRSREALSPPASEIVDSIKAMEAGDEHGGNPLEGKNILLAEDNALNMEIAVELLKMNGINRVECARDGQQVVDMFLESSQGEFDAILMDIQMPRKDGYEATREIRASCHPDARKVAIIATTANAFSEDVTAALTAGMYAHIGKPLDVKHFCDVLKDVLKDR